MTWSLAIAYAAFTVYVVIRFVLLLKEKAPDLKFAGAMFQAYDWVLLAVAASYWYKPACRFFRDSGTAHSYFGFGLLAFGLVLNLVVLIGVYGNRWPTLGKQRVPIATFELVVARIALPALLLSVVHQIFVVGKCP